MPTPLHSVGVYLTYDDREMVKVVAFSNREYTVQGSGLPFQATAEHLSPLWPNFGHCVWLTSGSHHFTVAMGLTEDAAIAFASSMGPTSKRLEFGEPIDCESLGFHFSFWPVDSDNGHVSFYYSTSGPRTTAIPPTPDPVFEGPVVMRCHGPQAAWYAVHP